MCRKSKRPAGGDGISEAPSNHRRGNGAARREAAGTGRPLPRARGPGRDCEPGHRGFDRKCTSIAPAPSAPCPSWPLAAASQRRNDKLCQSAAWFSSCSCLTHRVPVTPTDLQKYHETAVAEREICFSTIQCVPSTSATNVLPRGFPLFSQKNIP